LGPAAFSRSFFLSEVSCQRFLLLKRLLLVRGFSRTLADIFSKFILENFRLRPSVFQPSDQPSDLSIKLRREYIKPETAAQELKSAARSDQRIISLRS